jgi:hypothetical protein
MIVREDKTYEQNSSFLNSNPYLEETNFIVDETTEEGLALAQRIIAAYPYYDMVVVDGKLVDIIELPKPESIPQPSTQQEILWQTITDLQLDLIATNQALTDAQLEIELLKGGA